MSGQQDPVLPERVNDETVVSTIRRELLEWYRLNKRDLPWRKVRDPYKIWVSEIMLQQTRVDTVIPYYERFIERFPDPWTLASAPEEEVVKAWEGLGYYSRVRNFHSAVKEVVASYGGKVPDDSEMISKLKGIGSYTAGAILSIAYGKKVPAVDGNVMRVFSRLFAIEDDIASSKTRKKMEAIAWRLVPDDVPGDFNQALMELGALICTPSSPQCLFCPIRPACDAFERGLERTLPRKKKQKPPKREHVAFARFMSGGKLLLEKRSEVGLLAGMWGLPTIKVPKGASALRTIKKFCDENGIPATNYLVEGAFEHVFSHRHWCVTVVRVEVQNPDFLLLEGWVWLDERELDTKPISNVYRKAFRLF
jgi:A/G-specific adenine glycosylase